MKILGRRAFWLVLPCVFALGARALAPAVAQTTEKIFLETGHSRTVSSPGLTRVAIGDNRIAGVAALGHDEVLINGKAPGTTTLFVWSALGRVTYDVHIFAQGIDDLVPVMERAIAEPNVHIQNIGRAVIVSGTVPDGARALRLASILAQFGGVKTSGFDGSGSGSDDYKIINTVAVQRPFGDAERRIATISDAKNVHLVGDAKGNVIVSGEVKNRQVAEQVLALARGLAGQYLGVDGKVIDRLALTSTSQVDVRVYVLEIDDTGLKNLGIQLQSAMVDSSGNVTYSTPQFPAFENPTASVGQPSPNHPGAALNIGSFVRTTFLAPTLNAILQSGHGRLLSQPNLLTLPGVAANILVGGQVPYIYSTGLGAVSVLFKDYGVSLAITPTILGSGAIDCKVAPTVSQLDYADGVTLSGTTLPALTVSQLSTEVVTQPGESIVIGGLLQRVETRTLYKFPLLGDIPVLGQLFRSQEYQSKKTDVVFVMTPEVLER
jgi:Flp pilus assembly secretin CpaC